jgi:hypothetical protein
MSLALGNPTAAAVMQAMLLRVWLRPVSRHDRVGEHNGVGTPPDAFGGSNGVQSGIESRVSTLTIPLNRVAITTPRRHGGDHRPG